MPFADLCRHGAYRRASRCPRPASTRRPSIAYDRATHTGRPFLYFAYGAALSEVVIDTLTGEHRVVAVDILHDVGRSLNPAIDLGQIEGGFVQGMGWLTTEELVFDDRGRLLTHAPSTYKIPTASDRPARMDIRSVGARPQCRADDPPFQGGRRAAADAGDLGLLGADPGGGRGGAGQGAAAARRARDARAHPGRDRASLRARCVTGRTRRARRSTRADRAGHGAGDRRLGAARGRRADGGDARMTQHGTIGGGALEYQRDRTGARDPGQPPGSWRVQDYPLGPLLGQCCGGRVRLLVEHLDPDASRWLGAGRERVVTRRCCADARRARRCDGCATCRRACGARPSAGRSFVEPSDVERAAAAAVRRGPCRPRDRAHGCRPAVRTSPGSTRAPTPPRRPAWCWPTRTRWSPAPATRGRGRGGADPDPRPCARLPADRRRACARAARVRRADRIGRPSARASCRGWTRDGIDASAADLPDRHAAASPARNPTVIAVADARAIARARRRRMTLHAFRAELLSVPHDPARAGAEAIRHHPRRVARRRGRHRRRVRRPMPNWRRASPTCRSRRFPAG